MPFDISMDDADWDRVHNHHGSLVKPGFRPSRQVNDPDAMMYRAVRENAQKPTAQLLADNEAAIMAAEAKEQAEAQAAAEAGTTVEVKQRPISCTFIPRAKEK